jgi:hypothetical protein
MTTEDAPVAVTTLDMNRRFELQTLPNGNLQVTYCLPLIDVASVSYVGGIATYDYGGAMQGTDAISDAADAHTAGTLLLNPMVNLALQYGASVAQYAMVAPSSPHLGLQALSFSKYRVKKLGFGYQPQGQTFQEDAATLGESRLRFCFTADPTHPVLGTLGYRGTGIIAYELLTETPNSVQFAEWNAWNLDIADFNTDWLEINYPRFAPATLPTDTGTTALMRQTFFGAASLYDSYGTYTNTRVNMVHGQLWQHGVMEFTDPSPLLTSYVPPQLHSMLTSLSAVAAGDSFHFKGESKEEKKESRSSASSSPPGDIVSIDCDDPDVTCPPRWAPTPSKSPGAPLYKSRKP